MAKAKGTVTGCGKGKFSYFITLDTHEGFYFNTKYEPKCGEGDVVGIEFDKKADNRGNVKKVVVLEKNSSGYKDTGSGSAGSGSGAGATGGGDRQDSIVWQSSRKDALVLVGLLTSMSLVKVPAGDKGRIVVEALVDEVTARYFGDASNPKASKAYTENVEVSGDGGDGEGGDDWDKEPEPKGDDEWDDSWD